VFEFLVEEMASIKTRKFHLVDGPASLEFREAVESSGFSVPSSYMQFVLQFGNAKLYRRVDHYNSCYLVEVFAAPRETVSNDGERLLQIGHTRPNSTQLSFVYFKDPPILNGEESPVFEWQHGQEVRKTADGFLEWFEAKCSSARKRYQKSEWEVIENGPPPFTQDELAVVEARKRFRWQVVGIAPNGDLRFEVHNGSNMTLPYLFLGVRGKLRPPNSGPLYGGARLPTGSVHPGRTAIIEYGCYNKFVAPEDVEVFDLPDPGPEDRDYYWEFQALSQNPQ
jgi:hypothetical protein